jgi:phosphoribosyl-ATP pyrophosphohydrolase
MTSNDSLAQLAQVLQSRKSADPDSSYVARLLHKGPEAFLKKIGEEATELVMACKDADYASASPQATAQAHSKIVNETADLWFHSMVALAHYGLQPSDVIAELDRRVGTSGLDEKAARKAQTREATDSQGTP